MPPQPRRRLRRLRRSLRFGSVAAAIALAGTACSSGGSSSGTQTLKIITWVNPPAVTAIKAIDAEFHQKYPNITVSVQTAANVNGPYQTLLTTTVDSGSADIVTAVQPFQPLPLSPTRSNMTPFQFWSTHNVFLPLNGNSWLSDYTSSALAAETYNGKVEGIVSGAYQQGVFYNKAIFAKYHLSPPTTYTQFLSVLQALKSHHITPMYLGLGGVGPVYLQFIYNELMASAWYPSAPGANLAKDLENGTVKWTSPSFTTVMNEEKTLTQYLEPNYAGVPWQSMPGDFAKSDAAMLLDGSWDLAPIQQANPSMKVGFFALPGSNVAADNQSFAGNNLTFEVLRNAPDQAAALKWLQFFSTPKIYEQYVNATGVSPSQKAGSYNSFASKVLGSSFGKGIDGTVVYPGMSATGSYWDQPANWPTLQLDMIQGKKTPAQVEALYQSGWKTG